MSDSRLLDTHMLHTFVIIAESPSLTDAARRLGVTQSAVSQCLKQLEDQLGTALVVRRSRPLHLTAAGNALKQNAEGILGELRRLSARVRGAADQGLVHCRLGLITSCSEVFGSKLIAQLSPFIEQMTLRSGLTPPLMQAFLEREIDILVSNDPLTGVDGLERFELFRDPMLLAVSTQNLAGLAAPVSVESLARELPMIKYGRHTHIGAYSEVVLRRMGVQANVRYETDDTHTLMNFVHDGHGWAIFSALCLAQALYLTEDVCLLELDRSRHSRTLYLLAREGEMGSIPQQVAGAIRQILQGPVFDALVQRAPWLTIEAFAGSELWSDS
ncbi:LysR family transcriptional regulator [Marinobacterium rhizophilum]|uniref:LysR family transcriptional regulator n=1 Tax=Marinobacterium rhizophilum TaxID=420402 RepID=A0ABY5HEI5_9GAMM|nr:LysR family transcriptional regulator [Marinobacterium rhizophilum]UTW10256.1 LysR family transcriptional regulator [Marinobacterium rhizophilum]